jgi:protein-disulfide isomerase
VVAWGGTAAGNASDPGPPVPVAPAPASAAPAAPSVEPALPALPSVAASDLHSLVSPAVVALVVSSGSASARVTTGVLITASGLVLTSRRAVAAAIEGRGNITMVRGGPKGRVGSREIGESVPTRLIGVASDLDLALVEAMPATSIFYPHLPIVRRSIRAGAPLLAVGHDRARGLWAGAVVALGQGPALAGGAARWRRTIAGATGEPVAVAPGTPLVDAVGRIAALVTTPEGDEPRAIDADGLLRFVLAVDAPGRRFAGVPPYRRAAPTAGRGSSSTLSTGTGTAVPPARRAESAGSGPIPARTIDPDARGALEMPRMISKGQLDRNFPTARGGGAERAGTTVENGSAPEGKKGSGEVSHLDPELALTVAAAALERRPVPATLKLDIADAPDRGPMDAPITVVELGDYHAPQTRDAEVAVRGLTEGRDSRVRLFWKEADLGDGADYQVPARAAQAAREQSEFWSMHDRLISMKDPAALGAKDARQVAHAVGLDLEAFDQVFESDGVLSMLEGEGEKARRMPVLATPAFVVNGKLVDGGTVAASALRAAVDEELTLAAAKLDKQAVAEREALVASRQPLIESRRPLPGSPYDPDKLARGVSEAATRRASAAKSH